MGTVTEELTVAELATLAKFASPDSLLAKLLRIYHAQADLIAELQECLDVETPILPDAEGKPSPEFIEALTDALREYEEEPAAPVACDCDETVGFTHYADGSSTARCRKCGHSWPMAAQPAAPEPSVDNRDELLACARSWEPEVRLLGNVRACTIAKICVDAESAEAQLAAVRSLVALWRAQADDYENQAEAQDLAPMGPTCSVAVKMCAAELEDELNPRSDTKD